MSKPSASRILGLAFGRLLTIHSGVVTEEAQKMRLSRTRCSRVPSSPLAPPLTNPTSACLSHRYLRDRHPDKVIGCRKRGARKMTEVSDAKQELSKQWGCKGGNRGGGRGGGKGSRRW